MKLKNSNLIISRLCAIASILLVIAVITINNSFSINYNRDSIKKWDVYFVEPYIVGTSSNRVIVNNDILNIDVNLASPGEEFQVFTSLNNDGDFDAYLALLDKTDLSKIFVSPSNEYKISDFVDYDIIYQDADTNNVILENQSLKKGDILNKQTRQRVIVTIKYKDIESLSEDKIKFLNDRGTTELKLNLSIKAVYQQN